MPEEKEYLVLLDCDRIQEHVFATGRLKEIRGASAQIREFIEKTVTGLRDFVEQPGTPRLVNAGGGMLKAVFSDKDDAEKFILESEKLFRKSTYSASLTGCLVEIDGGFGAAVERGERELRRLKDGRTGAFQCMGGGFIRFCQTCGRYPAAWHGRGDGRYDGRWLCRSCQEKRRVADAVSNSRKDGCFWDKFLEEMDEAKKAAWREATRVEELAEMGELAKPRGYIGFVYCDANRMGERLKRLQNECEHREFSKTVDAAGMDSAAEALRTLYPEPVEGKVPFEVVIYGGDDLILICTAERAVRFADEYCRRFQKKTGTLGGGPDGEGISVSAGVVIAHATHPILGLYSQAKQLLVSAKRKSYEVLGSEEKEACTLDFVVATNPSLRPLEVARKEDYRRDDFSGKRYLTARPYLCGRAPVAGASPGARPGRVSPRSLYIGDLMRHIGELKEAGFPRNKLKAMYDALFMLPKAQATMELQLIRSRLGDEASEAFGRFAAGLGISAEFPWAKDNGVFFTPLPDLVELYDYVGG